MEESTSREKVLKKVRDALIDKTELPYPVLDLESSVYIPQSDSLDVLFAEQFVKASGKFVYCESEDEFVTNLQSFILQSNWPVLTCTDPVLQQILRAGGIPFESNYDGEGRNLIGLQRCEALIARTGTIMLASQPVPESKAVRVPGVNLVLATASQLVPDLKQAFLNLRKKYSDRFPSDITLITGLKEDTEINRNSTEEQFPARELYLFFIDDSSASGI